MKRVLFWLAAALLFAVPLWATGEWGVWALEEPVSHLVWDEAMEGPDEDGVTSPGAGPELDGSVRVVVALVALPAVLAGLVWAWARRVTSPP